MIPKICADSPRALLVLIYAVQPMKSATATLTTGQSWQVPVLYGSLEPGL